MMMMWLNNKEERFAGCLGKDEEVGIEGRANKQSYVVNQIVLLRRKKLAKGVL